MNRRERQAQQLGVSYGAACHHLKKNILFKYIKLAGEHYCYSCNKEIISASDMSIEHKQPWENRDPELFWDLDNIAFSHVKCNLPHTRMKQNIKARKIGPEGTAWCATCKQFLKTDDFAKSRNRWNGYSNDCKACHKIVKKRLRGK